MCAWTERLGDAAPHWRVLCKPPLKEKTGDLRWHILHGAIASNAFISVLHFAVSSQCPFSTLAPEKQFSMFLLSLADSMFFFIYSFNQCFSSFNQPLFLFMDGVLQEEKQDNVATP